MKKTIKTTPIKITNDLTLAVEHSIQDSISWTAQLPKGEFDKLRKVCKPVACNNGLVFWVLDNKKVEFIEN
mgnify:FL=1